MRFLKKTAAILTLTASMPAMASGIPTVDIVNIIQTTFSAFESIEQTVTMAEDLYSQYEQYEQMIKSYEEQIEQFETMSGSYGLGGILDGDAKALDRRWAPSDWSGAISTVQAGGIPGTNQSYTVAIERMQNATKYSGDLGMQQNGHMGDYSKSYDRRMAADNVGGAIASVSFGKFKERASLIETLITKIDEAEDQKEAIDLGNVLTAQMLLMQNESMQLQATMVQMLRAQGSSDIEAQKLEAKFGNFL